MVKVIAMEKPESIQQRYSDYNHDNSQLTGNLLQKFMKDAIQTAHHQKLVELEQLKQIQRILSYPTNRSAPKGIY